MYFSLSERIAVIWSARQGGKTTFYISVTLKEYFPLYFCKVSMVLDMPSRMRFTDFLRKSDRKSQDTISGAVLKRIQISSIYTIQHLLYLESQSYLTICDVVRGFVSPSSLKHISYCTSATDFTKLAFILITSHFILDITLFKLRVLPAPGEPVTIINRQPFFYFLRQACKKVQIFSISFSRNLNQRGMVVPFRYQMAQALRRSKLRIQSEGFSQTESVLRLQLLRSMSLLRQFLVFLGIQFK